MREWISPCVSELVIHRNSMYMYKSLSYVLGEVMKHNLDVFSMWSYFWKACKINSSGVILKFPAINDRFPQKYFKPKVLISLINSTIGITYFN